MNAVLKMMSVLVIAAMPFAQINAKEITLYSVYGGDRLDIILKPFTDRTGITVNIVSGESIELINRMTEEGENTLADLHIDKDLVFQGIANQAGLYRAFDSEFIEKTVPAPFKESGRNFLTLFYRARTIMYNPNTVSPSELSTYEDLGSPKWKGRLCVRVANSSYNEGLVAFLVTHYGPAKAERIVKSWMNNLAVAPMSNDRAMIAGIADGRCDVALVNTYYLAPFVAQDPSFPVKVFFANQNETSNVHVNGVGIGMIKHTKNVAEATLLMEYLLSAEVQAPVAAAFGQYPVNPNAQIDQTLIDFGSYKFDQTNIGTISNFVETAKSIMKSSNWK